MNKECAVYKGEALLCLGKLKECAKNIDVKEITNLFYFSATWTTKDAL